MPSINLVKVLDLLLRAAKVDVKISLNREELVVTYPKSKIINQEILKEITNEKESLIEYFNYYKNEFDTENNNRYKNEKFYCDLKVSKAASNLEGHILALNDCKTGVPLFLIPGIGGKSRGYQVLGAKLNNFCPVYGIEMMGTNKGEEPLGSIGEITKQNVKWIKNVQPKGPYYFIGHSFGCYVLYDMILALEELGEKVEIAFVLDSVLKEKIGLLPNSNELEYILNVSRDYFESFKIISTVPDWENELRKNIEKFAETKVMLNCIKNFMKLKYPNAIKVIEYVMRLIKVRVHNDLMKYNPQKRINSRIVVFKAIDNRELLDVSMGWDELANSITVHPVRGDHHTMLDKENVDDISRQIKKECCLISQNKLNS